MWVEQLLMAHPFLIFIAGGAFTWITNFGVSAFISSLPAPTKESTQMYRFWFKFANSVLAQNPSRANGIRVESSPNWNDALRLALRMQREIEKELKDREGGPTC